MASIAAGVKDNYGTVGVAPDAKLLLVQATSSVSSSTGLAGAGIDMAAVIKGMTWAESQGTAVINLSLGSTYDSNFKAGTTQVSPGIFRAAPNYTNTQKSSFAYLYGSTVASMTAFTSATKSSVIVAAAGNSGTPYAQYPGAYATRTDANGNLLLGGRMLIVGNVKADGKGGWIMNEASNRAGTLCQTFVGNVCQDKYYVKDFYVVAPGTGLWGAVPDAARTAAGIASGGTDGIGSGSGTSQAAAIVSGGIALIKQAWPQLKAAEIVQLVKTTATDLGKAGVDEVYGYGMVNFDKATQPYADVKYSKTPLASGAAVAGTSLTTTALAGNISKSLGTSSVLKSVQVVDGMNRNFTADFTRAIGVSTPANSLYTSPYLAMQSTGYKEFATPFNQDTAMTFMQSQTGLAFQVDTKYGQGRVNFQIGNMTEQNGFLNNFGSGLLATGNSSTTYAMIGGERAITDTVSLIGSYGMGVTKTSNMQDSFLALSPTLISDTWKVGLAKKDIFFSGKTRDQLTLAMHGPVAIRKGYADVTAVTGYTYSGEEDDVTATPVITTERVNLASGRRQTDLILGYSVSVGSSTYAGISFAKQFNIGGVSGQTGNAVGVMVRSAF
jgi:hypothetical protein